MIDEETELTRLEAGEKVILYHHKILSVAVEDLEADVFQEEMRKALVGQVCSSPASRTEFFDHGITLRNRYLDRNERLISEVDLSASDSDS